VEPKLTVAQMTEKFLQLRRKKQALQDQHKAVLAPYNELLARLGNLILAELNAAGVNSMASAEGTVYKSVETSVTVKNWAETLTYIQENEAWDLLEARVAKTAAVTIMQETQAPIPGVNVNQQIVLRVRSG